MSHTKDSKKKLLLYIIGGDMLIGNFMARQLKLFLLIFLFTILFISNRYSCMKKLTEIEKLKEQLRDIEYENLILSVDVASSSRLSQIEQLLQSKGIDLFIPKTAAVELFINK